MCQGVATKEVDEYQTKRKENQGETDAEMVGRPKENGIEKIKNEGRL